MKNSIKPLSIGIISYDYAHLKTEQIIHKLLQRNGDQKYSLTIFALPFAARKTRSPLIDHRPDQFQAAQTRELAERNNINFIAHNGQESLLDCDYYLIAGASILPKELILNRKIINAHPGIIPGVRGLDSFKWAIFSGKPLGVTLHYIDHNIDVGEIISVQKTPVYSNDTLYSLARRHYEIEIDMTVDFLWHLQNPNPCKIPETMAHMRMPHDTEKEVIEIFPDYKLKYQETNAEENQQ